MPLIDLTEGEIEGLLDMDSRNLMFADKPSLRKSLLAKLRNPQAVERWEPVEYGYEKTPHVMRDIYDGRLRVCRRITDEGSAL